MRYPLCKKREVLRKTRTGKPIISTLALHKLLGEKHYQECRKQFKYYGEYPDPATVEAYLRGKKL